VSLYDIDPGPEIPELVRMIVEIPKNSGHKYEYDGKLGVFRLDRVLYSPMHYPGDYGFIPGTVAEDGDPMDVLALVEDPSFTGCLIEVRPVGVLNMVDQEIKDQKIIAVPKRDPRYEQVHTMDQIYAHVRREIEHFFTIYKELEGRVTEMQGWGGPHEARKTILDSRNRYLSQRDAQVPAAETDLAEPAKTEG
jgi:inorganic pyrophosphatase